MQHRRAHLLLLDVALFLPEDAWLIVDQDFERIVVRSAAEDPSGVRTS